MNKRNLNTILIAGLVIFLGLYLIFNYQNKTTYENQPLQESTESIQQNEEIPVPKQATPEELITQTIDEFFLHFEQTAPPEPNEQAILNTAALLTEGALTQVPTNNGQYSFAPFVGIQDFPDEGYEIDTITLSANPATLAEEEMADVTVTLKYSGNNTQRIFTMTKVNDAWKIDGVSMP